IGAPAGWSVPSGYSGNSGGMDFMACYVLRGGSAPSMVFTFSGSSIYREIQIVTLQPATGTVGFDSASAIGTTGSSAHAPNPPSTTAVASASLAICGGWD